METTAHPIRPQSTTREDNPALVYYSSRFGQAARIAQVLAERLTEQGHFAQARPLTATTATVPAHSPAVLLVASIRYGHFAPEVMDFVRINAENLRTVPSGFVSVSLTARKPEKRSPQTHSYTRKFLLQASQSGWTPTWCSVLAGALRYPRYHWLDRQMIRLIMWITNGPTAPETDMEFTDWKQVDELAQSVSSALYLPSPGSLNPC